VASSKKWYVYIVECCDKSLYTGITTDVERRVKEHNGSKKGAKYTRTRRPVRLVKHWEFENRRQAIKEEIRIKKLKKSDKIKLIT
tara:strand:+ start:383 stop:637 length:255 start_codon:yes stop_codon:yes gene_type:complete